MKAQLLSALRVVDRRLAARVLRHRRERPSLLVFAVHSLFQDEHEPAIGGADPFHPVLISDFERFVAYFLNLGYQFVTPAQIVEGLDPAGHYVWLTFDDGYANNLRALTVLRTFGVAATFFVSTNHVAEGRAFWWDALYRERRRRGKRVALIRREQQALKSRPHREIEAYVRAQFGSAALDPIGDCDRPMTVTELRALASEPLATLGNHTTDHALLTQCDEAEVRTQVRSAQDFLTAIGGRVPEAIAYPDGRYNARVVQLVRAEGLHLGVGTWRGKNHLPLAGFASMRIARCSVPWGPTSAADCLIARSDVGVIKSLRWLGAPRR